MPADTTQHNKSISSQDESSETILKRFDWYIGVQTKRVVRRYPALAQQAVVDLEIDELMQRVRIKFWRALERGPILYPRNYIQRIIRSEIIDMGRQRKPSVPLPTNEDEHQRFWEMNGFLFSNEHGPADEVEQQMESSALLERAIPLVLSLPPRQRLAMICALQERVDDLMQLVDGFKDYHTDIETLHWPSEQHEKRVLQAALVVARQTIARKMQEEKRINEVELEPQKAIISSIESDAKRQIIHLKEPYQSAIQLHYVEGISYPEIAARLQIPIGTVKAQVSRGKKLLQSLIQSDRANKQVGREKKLGEDEYTGRGVDLRGSMK